MGEIFILVVMGKVLVMTSASIYLPIVAFSKNAFRLNSQEHFWDWPLVVVK